MKQYTVLDSISYVSPDLIAEADTASPVAKRHTVRWVAVAACLCVAAVGAGAASRFLKAPAPMPPAPPPAVSDDPLTFGEKDEMAGPFTEDTWSQTGNAGRYLTLSFDGIDYTTCGLALRDDRKGELLGDGTAVGQDYFSLEIHKTAVDVYAIRGVSSRCAVAVHFREPDASATGQDNVYAYTNADYSPQTLGDFLRDLDLAQTLTVGDAYVPTADGGTLVYTGVRREELFALLTSCADAVNQPEADTAPPVMEVAVSLFGTNKAVCLTEDGYVWTNLLETRKCFYVGANKVADFAATVTGNSTGTPYVPDTATDGEPE